MEMTQTRTNWKTRSETVKLAAVWGLIFFVVGTILDLVAGAGGVLTVAGLVGGAGFGTFLSWKNYPDY